MAREPVDYADRQSQHTFAIASMTYDADGQQAGEARGNVATTFGYDPGGRLKTLSDNLAETPPAPSADIASTFAYNPASQLVTRARSNTGYALTRRKYVIHAH